MNIDLFADAIISRNHEKTEKFEVRHFMFIASMVAVPFVFLIVFLINRFFISAVAAGIFCMFSVFVDFINLIGILHVSDNMKLVTKYFSKSRIVVVAVFSVIVLCEVFFRKMMRTR